MKLFLLNIRICKTNAIVICNNLLPQLEGNPENR